MNMAVPWTRRWRLGTRLTVAVILLLLPLQVFVVASYIEIREQRRTAEIEHSVEVGTSVAAIVEGFIRDVEGTVLAVALAVGTRDVPMDQASIGPYLTAALRQYPALRAIFVTDLNGFIIATPTGDQIGFDVSSRPYISALKAGADSVWTDGIPGTQTGETTVAFGRVVRDANGASRAYIVAAFYPARFVQQLSLDFPSEASLTLIDDRGALLYDSSLPNPPSEVRSLAGSPGVAAALNGELVRVEGMATPLPGESRFGVLVPIARNGWVVGLTQPQARLETALWTQFARQVGAVSLAMLIAAALMALMAHRLARPLGMLAATAGAIARGERPSVPALEADAEVTQLGSAMQLMTEAVLEREDRLRRIARQQQMVAQLGQRALAGVAPSALRNEAETLVAEALGIQPKAASDLLAGQLSLAQIQVGGVSPANGQKDTQPSDDDSNFVQSVRGVLGTAEEVETARARLTFIAEASAVLASSLDYQTTLQSVARLAVSHLADYCVIDVLEPDGSLDRLATAHRDPAQDVLVSRLREFPPDPGSAHPLLDVLHLGESRVIPEVGEWFYNQVSRSPEHRSVLNTLSPTSYMAVPLMARGRTIGAITLVATHGRQRFGASDRSLAEDLARRAAVAVDNARLYQEAQEAVLARDEFLSIASHELRTPVTGIRGYAQMLLRAEQRGQLEPERLRRSLEAVDRSTDRLEELTNDLLDVSRIRMGRLPLQLEQFDLAEFVCQATAEYRERLSNEHRLTVQVTDGACVITGDIGRIEQVLTNLLDNAVKYSPGGGEIQVSLTTEDSAVALSVRDTGIGMPPEATELIFEPFGRASNAARQSIPGLGLGLHICRSIVERHGGRMWAESAGEGLGTTLQVRLPIGGPPGAQAGESI